ncbi:flagellin [Deferribacterales bacterium RsTz2092]|nr:flagellin [Deferribacterales bacterium]
MSLAINTNVFANTTKANIDAAVSVNAMSRSAEYMPTDTEVHINRTPNDTAELAASDKLQSELGPDTLLLNAESSVGIVGDILQRMRELAIQASNPTASANDRELGQHEFEELKHQLNYIANAYEFNPNTLPDGADINVQSAEAGQSAVYKSNTFSPVDKTAQTGDISQVRLMDLEQLSVLSLGNTMHLTIYGNGNSSSVYVNGEDTLQDFINNISQAIVNGLNTGTPEQQPSDIVRLVQTGEAGANIIIQSGLAGKQSELRFAGSEQLLNELGIMQIQGVGDSNIAKNAKSALTGDLSTSALDIDDSYIVTQSDAQIAVTKLNKALGSVNSLRGDMGVRINWLMNRNS